MTNFRSDLANQRRIQSEMTADISGLVVTGLTVVCELLGLNLTKDSVFIIKPTAIYSTRLPMLTQPSTLHGKEKWANEDGAGIDDLTSHQPQ